MKIIEWNSQGAFRKKHEDILTLKPHILVIPECECEEKLQFGTLTPQPKDFIWFGDSPNKGIGIFSYSDYKLKLLPSYNPNFKFIIPIQVSNRKESFLLFAIWAKDNKEFPEARYIGQIWLAINYYKELLNLPIIIAGDFNSNTIWDDKKRVGNHTGLVKFLSRYNIHSIYHTQNKQEQGLETDYTFFMYRKKEKPYHIDYFFTSIELIQKDTSLEIKKFNDWKHLSDHVPLIFETNIPDNNFQCEQTFSSLIIKSLTNLSKETRTRFQDKIEELSRASKSLDSGDLDESNIAARKVLTKKIDWLNHINQVIEKI